MKKILIALFLFFSFCQLSFAQSQPVLGKTLTINFLGNDFATPQAIRNSSLSAVLRDKKIAKFKDMAHGFGLTYTSGLTPHTDVAVSVNGTFGSLPISNRNASGNDNFLLEVDASGNFKMLPEGATFNPYLIAGVGASKYTSIYGAFIPLGAGFKFNIFNEAHVNVHLQYRIPVITDANAYHFQVGFGIGGLISERKSEPVKEVAPPPPTDTDGDGIPDNEDKCPTVPGVARYNGCPVPDTDKDGIDDEHDKCPTVPGTAKYNGCPVPDTDGDGINDEEDKCPTVAGVARYNGCPVPDTDGDGVNDEEDKCPTVPGTKANNGCPEVTKEMEKKMNYAAKRIFFVTGSAKLSSRSDAALNEVIKILNDDKNVKLSIEGHTDNVGKADYNKTLSDKRANSVKTYLVNHGVDESRLTAEGFGLERPVASNKTSAGRAQNRRVELKLSY
ncbi:OmpA family protein [Flavisolibacter ginsenosidimutans]|uniref:OmpA family protein n=1 Tax=Flavisolibacter ginsenosidimutans TaxID=661481 RepID=A0A5B8UP53_9BACT|nr:OmpA family protein [Flavisolibacter ginsenosidimutans]QEC58236.1 OmpA family protein [Flavisolibacter ginsenosidimutans]